MRKEKKSSKRLTKKQLAEKLMSFFQTQPEETFSFKQIFHALKLTTHPAKMLAIDVMEELAWDDSCQGRRQCLYIEHQGTGARRYLYP